MKPFTTIAALLFVLVAAAHAYRLYMGWVIVAGPYNLPAWVSYGGAIVPLILAVMLFREARN